MKKKYNMIFLQGQDHCPPKELFEKITNSQEWLSLFSSHESIIYKEKTTGKLSWKSFLHKQVEAQYNILSCVNPNHLIVNIDAPNCSSTLLITIDGNQKDSVVKIDHRGFLGKEAHKHYKMFSKRWEKMLKKLKIFKK